MKRAGRIVAALVLLVAFVLALRSQWDEVGDRLDELSPGAVALALLLTVAGIACSLPSWRTLLGALGSWLPWPAAARVFFVGQLGKYLPGSVWPVMTQMELARDHDVPRRRTAAATLVAIALGILASLLVAAAALPFAGDEAAAYRWVWVAVPVLLVVLHPPVLTKLLNTAARLVRREPLESPLRRGPLLAALGWTVLGWVLQGLAAFVLARDLGGTGADLAPLAVGAFTLAWAAGFLVLVVPGGLGVREAAVVVLLADRLGTPTATLVAVVLRLLGMIADAGLAAAGATAGRRARQD